MTNQIQSSNVENIWILGFRVGFRVGFRGRTPLGSDPYEKPL